MIVIGIDPPKGVAIWSTNRRCFQHIGTTDFWGCIAEINGQIKANGVDGVCVVIEAPQLNKPVFTRKDTSPQEMMRIAQNVGANKETSKLIIDYCEKYGVRVRPVPPLRGELKKWKKDKAEFARMTGWAEATSEHGRDAAALVWGSQG